MVYKMLIKSNFRQSVNTVYGSSGLNCCMQIESSIPILYTSPYFTLDSPVTVVTVGHPEGPTLCMGLH